MPSSSYSIDLSFSPYLCLWEGNATTNQGFTRKESLISNLNILINIFKFGVCICLSKFLPNCLKAPQNSSLFKKSASRGTPRSKTPDECFGNHCPHQSSGCSLAVIFGAAMESAMAVVVSNMKSIVSSVCITRNFSSAGLAPR